MSVLNVRTIANLEDDGGGDLLVTSEDVEFTLCCDWPDCGKELVAIKKPGFLKKAGWRYCGTGKEHLCPDHSRYSDEELAEKLLKV